jgi:hypothetical protein
MKHQAQVLAGFFVGVAILSGPAAQASSFSGAAASAASQAGNSAAQSAVRAARDDAARRAMAQHHWNQELRRSHRHDYSR